MTPGEAARSIIEQLADEMTGSRRELTAGQVVDEYSAEYGSRKAIRQMAIDYGLRPGTTAYRSFRRRVERYVTSAGQTRRARPDWLRALSDRIQSRRPASSHVFERMADEGFGILSFKGKIQVSGERAGRPRTWTELVAFEPDELDGADGFIDLCQTGEWDRAGVEIAERWGDGYIGSGAGVRWKDVDEVTAVWVI